MNKSYLTNEEISRAVKIALKEDIGSGDITSNNLIAADAIVQAKIYAKSEGVISGLAIANYVFKHFDKEIEMEHLLKDGDVAKKGETVVRIKGKMRALLTGERTVLNFMQRMSGIATNTKGYVDEVAHTKCQILDTRKTVPGLRNFDKYSVFCGGATNHRMGLHDMVMIKDNHIKAAGSITNAIKEIQSKIGPSIKIEVETTNLDEVTEAVRANPDIIMLDNMDLDMTRRAVKIIDQRCKIEASGNMTLDRVKSVAETGVDYISVGALTHSVKALDLSMLIE